MTTAGDQRDLTEFVGPDGAASEALPDHTPEGYDHDWNKRVRKYAERVTSGGWKLSHVSTSSIWWVHPDPKRAKTYKIEHRKAGWTGVRCNRPAKPGYTDDIKEALDGAGEWLAENPLDVSDQSSLADETDDSGDTENQPTEDNSHENDADLSMTDTTETADTPRVLTVVSCGSSKQDLEDGETVPARELYTSAIHSCKDTYGQHSHGYFIASAKFRLVEHDEELPEYDQRLSERSEAEQREWGQEVVNDLQDAVIDHDADAVVFVGGKEYVNPILHAATEQDLQTPLYTPWQSLEEITGSGKGMSWCNEEENWPENLEKLNSEILGEQRLID